MIETVHKAINKNGKDYILFIPREIKDGNPYGDYGFLNVDILLSGNTKGRWESPDSDSEHYNYANSFKIEEASNEEAEWYRLCKTAGKTVERPVIKEMFPTY